MKFKLLKELQQKAKEISINELKNMTPERLMKLLCVNKRELEELVNYLHSKCVLDYKYRFTCNCGYEYTIYERKIKKELLYCPNCEMEISKDNIINTGWIIYNINKEELMKLK